MDTQWCRFHNSDSSRQYLFTTCPFQPYPEMDTWWCRGVGRVWEKGGQGTRETILPEATPTNSSAHALEATDYHFRSLSYTSLGRCSYLAPAVHECSVISQDYRTSITKVFMTLFLKKGGAIAPLAPPWLRHCDVGFTIVTVLMFSCRYLWHLTFHSWLLPPDTGHERVVPWWGHCVTMSPAWPTHDDHETTSVYVNWLVKVLRSPFITLIIALNGQLLHAISKCSTGILSETNAKLQKRYAGLIISVASVQCMRMVYYTDIPANRGGIFVMLRNLTKITITIVRVLEFSCRYLWQLTFHSWLLPSDTGHERSTMMRTLCYYVPRIAHTWWTWDR